MKTLHRPLCAYLQRVNTRSLGQINLSAPFHDEADQAAYRPGHTAAWVVLAIIIGFALAGFTICALL